MTRAQLFACAGPACLVVIAATPAFAQTGPRPLVNGHVLSWPGKTLPVAPAEVMPAEDAAPVLLPPPATPAEREPARAETGWREAPPVERITLPARAAATAESRYGPRRIEARVEAPVREEPRVNARTVAAVSAPRSPESSRAPLTPAEAAPGGWIILPSRSAQAAAAALDTQAPLQPLFRQKPAPAPTLETAHLASPPVAAPVLPPRKAAPPVQAAMADSAPHPAPIKEAVAAPLHETPRVKPAPAPVKEAAAAPVHEPAPVKRLPAPVETAEAASAKAAPEKLAANAPAPELAPGGPMTPPSHPWYTRFPTAAADVQPVEFAKAEPAHKAKPAKAAKAAKAEQAAAKEAPQPVQTAQAALAPPRPLPVSNSSRPGVHFYSVHRDYGIAPTPAPIPPQFFGATADLSEPDGPELPPSQMIGKGAAAARNRALADNASPDS